MSEVLHPLASAIAALSLPPSTFNRRQKQPSVPDPDIDLTDPIKRLALAMSAYGYRQMTLELRRERKVVNLKRVLHILREHNLACLRKKRFVKTTDSEHGLPIYSNLTIGLKVTDINNLWVSEITYIRSQDGVRLSSCHPGRIQSQGARLGALAAHRYRINVDSA